MLHKVFTVYDVASEAYLQPFFAPTKGQALRSFTECVNDTSHNFGKYPEQYVLFELGSFEDTSCNFELHSCPVSVGVGTEFVRPKSDAIVRE